MNRSEQKCTPGFGTAAAGPILRIFLLSRRGLRPEGIDEAAVRRGFLRALGGVRRFGDLPRAAQLYTAAMVRSLIAMAYGDALPAELPNLRYLGVGPQPSQIIKDVPATRDLLTLR